MDKFTVFSLMEAINPFFPKETSFAIADDHQFIYYQPSKKIDLKIKPGDKVIEGTVTHKALTVQQKTAEVIDSDLFGVSYYGVSFPIFDQGTAKGCVTAIMPSKHFETTTQFLTIKTEDRWIPIPFNKIMYLEAQNRKTKVQSEKGSGLHKYNLSELEILLPYHSFIRCHRAFIVNLNYIAEIHPDSHSTFTLIMKDQAKIPVSQTYTAQFRRALGF